MSLVAFLPIKGANAFIINDSNQVSNSLPDLQGRILLTLSWHSFSEWGRECVAFCLTYKCGLYLINECLQPIASQTNHDVRTKIVDTPSTLISRMGWGVFYFLFWLSMQPIPHLWMSTSNRHSEYPRCNIKNLWCSVDSHSQDGARSVSLYLLIIMAANKSKKTMTYHSHYFAIDGGISECDHK